MGSYRYLLCNILCYILEGLIFRKSLRQGSLCKFHPMWCNTPFQHFKQCILNELAQIEFINADGLEDIPQQD